jgi:small subunit ribosomal protein S1
VPSCRARQVDIRPIRDVGPLMGMWPQPFADPQDGPPPRQHRRLAPRHLEETRAEQRSELVQNLAEGQVVEGVVKNITDYGAFVDLGGIDGLLHVTDMPGSASTIRRRSWNVGQTVKVQIIRINPETQRISLGMKQLEKIRGMASIRQVPGRRQAQGPRHQHHRLRRVRRTGAGIEGLIHVSEMSWTKKNVHPGKILSTSQEVDVQVLEVDAAKRRISLGLKQTQENPWEAFKARTSEGHGCRRRSQEHHRVRPVRRPRRRCRRHGPPLRPRLERPGEEAIKEYKKGDMSRPVLDVDRRRSASRSASSSSAAIRSKSAI